MPIYCSLPYRKGQSLGSITMLVVEHFGTERSETVGNGRDGSETDCAGIPRIRAYSVTGGNGWDRE